MLGESSTKCPVSQLGFPLHGQAGGAAQPHLTLVGGCSSSGSKGWAGTVSSIHPPHHIFPAQRVPWALVNHATTDSMASCYSLWSLLPGSDESRVNAIMNKNNSIQDNDIHKQNFAIPPRNIELLFSMVILSFMPWATEMVLIEVIPLFKFFISACEYKSGACWNLVECTAVSSV